MKKLILILTIFLLVSNVFALDLDEDQINGLTDEEKSSLLEQYESLTDEQKADLIAKGINIEDMKDLSVKEIMTMSLETSSPEIPNQVKKFMPFHVKLNVKDKDETFIIAMDKAGDITLLDEGKHHVLLEFDFDEMMDILIAAQSNQEINGEDLLENLEITSNSFKGALMLNTLEKMMKRQMVKNRSFGYKTVGFFTSPISWFIK